MITKKEFLNGKRFTFCDAPTLEMQYSETMFGGELIISNQKVTVRYEIEQITKNYIVIECWLTSNTDNKLFYKDLILID